MTEGLYSVSFSAPGGNGSGVVAVGSGTLNGGDSGYAYLGTFSVEGGKLSSTLRVLQHNRSHISVFGAMRDFSLALSGAAEGDRFTLKGTIPEQPGMTITIQGQRIAELAR